MYMQPHITSNKHMYTYIHMNPYQRKVPRAGNKPSWGPPTKRMNSVSRRVMSPACTRKGASWYYYRTRKAPRWLLYPLPSRWGGRARRSWNPSPGPLWRTPGSSETPWSCERSVRWDVGTAWISARNKARTRSEEPWQPTTGTTGGRGREGVRGGVGLWPLVNGVYLE